MTAMELHFDNVERCMGILRDRIRECKICPGPKQSGAVRRASMDLTRALAEMRAAK